MIIIVVNRRKDVTLVSNSIGLVSMQANDVTRQHYYWGTRDDGYPAPSLSLTSKNNFFRDRGSIFHKLYDPNQHQRDINSKLSTIELLDQFYTNTKVFWPFSGIAIKSSTSCIQAAIVGQFVVNGSSKTKKDATTAVSVDSTKSIKADKSDNPLFFDEACSAYVLITNPHDPPNFWKYEHAYFPQTRKSAGVYHWFAFADSSGKSYVDDSTTNKAEPVFLFVLGSYDPKPVSALTSDNSYDFFAVDAVDTFQVVGRMSASNFAQFKFDTFEILCEDNIWRLLYDDSGSSYGSKNVTIAPKALFGPLLTEASFNYDSASRKWIVVSLKPPDSRIQLCSADTLDATWTCEYIADVPKPWSDTKTFLTYAAKYHSELSPSSTVSQSTSVSNKNNGLKSNSTNIGISQTRVGNIDLIISVVPNSAGQISLLFEESEIGIQTYTPKFINIRSKQ